MLKLQKKRPEFTDSVEATLLKAWHVELFKEVKPKQIFFVYDTPDDLPHIEHSAHLFRKAGYGKLIFHCDDPNTPSESKLLTSMQSQKVLQAFRYPAHTTALCFSFKIYEAADVSQFLVISSWYAENQMPVIAYSSLERGFFSRKFKAGDYEGGCCYIEAGGRTSNETNIFAVVS